MNTQNPLPKTLRGAVCKQYRWVNGKRYGPYWFRFWREEGKLRKEYVSKQRLEETRAACREHRLDRQARIAADQAWREAAKGSRLQLMELKALIEAMKEKGVWPTS